MIWNNFCIFFIFDQWNQKQRLYEIIGTIGKYNGIDTLNTAKSFYLYQGRFRL